MADPVTLGMAAVSIGSTIFGGIEGAKGAAQKADAQTAMYQYKAGIAQANQKIAMQNAQQAYQDYGVKGQLYGLQAGQAAGKLKAAQAASGINLTGGSASMVRASQLAGVQTEEGMIAHMGAQKAYGEQVQAMNFAGEAGLAAMGGQFAQEQKGIDVAQSYLGATTSVADKWMQYSKAGVFGGSGGSGGSGGFNMFNFGSGQ